MIVRNVNSIVLSIRGDAEKLKYRSPPMEGLVFLLDVPVDVCSDVGFGVG